MTSAPESDIFNTMQKPVVVEELRVALRIMLPSKAKVGDTIHFVFPNSRLSGMTISAFEVTINGKKIDKPEMLTTRAVGGGSTNFVFKVSEPGTYQFEITPIIDGKKGEPRLNTLEVESGMARPGKSPE